MNIKLRLTLLNFFPIFCLGCMVNYHSQLLVWYKTMGRYQVWSCFQYYGICLYFYADTFRYYCRQMDQCRTSLRNFTNTVCSSIIFLPQVADPGTFFWVMLIAMCFYMPTIALNNSISYTVLKMKEKM